MEHLIPPDWFKDLPWYWLLLILVATMTTLIKGADWLVLGASEIAFRMGVPQVIVGATIVALGTTSPETAVSVMAAIRGDSGLALGNAVGSIIADSGLIFGIGCLMTALPADRYVLNRQGWIQFCSGIALAVVCYAAFLIYGGQAEISRGVGIFFLLSLAVYLRVSIRWSRQHPKGKPFVPPEELDETVTSLKESDHRDPQPVWKLCGLMIAGLVVVVFSSHILICSVSELAVQFHVPQVVISATLVAFGTSLPELVVGMTAIRKGHPELLVGNVIGADILNVLFVIGASATAVPLPVLDMTAKIPEVFLYIHLPTMILVLILFRVAIAYAIRRGSFHRGFGIPLLVLYVVYIIIQLNIPSA